MSCGHLAVVCYSFHPHYQARLAATVGALLGGLREARVVIVRGPQAPPCRQLRPYSGVETVELDYDGSGWEFGAYQQGLDHLRGQGWHGAVAVINDTSGIHYPQPAGELAELRQRALDDGDGAAELAGHVQAAPAGFAYRGQALTGWVRSNAFVLSSRALVALEQRLFVAEDFDAPRCTSRGLELPDFVSPELGDYLRTWLSAGGRDGWARHVGRSEVAPELLRRKAGSILLEKRMVARVLAAGGRLRHCGPPAEGAWPRLKLRAFYWKRRLSPGPVRLRGPGPTS